MAKRRVEKEFLYTGFGFPLVIENCPMIEAFGEWVPAVNFVALEETMAIAVALKPVRLTGAEVKFLRLHFNLPMQELADLLGISRQAVARWEKRGQELTDMNWSTEKDIRLSYLAKLGADPEQFQEAFKRLRLAAVAEDAPKSEMEEHHVRPTDIVRETRDRAKLIRKKLSRLDSSRGMRRRTSR